jgi:uncharacterized membrane protein (UPF0136 family)
MNEQKPTPGGASELGRSVIVLAGVLAAITAYGMATGIGTTRRNAEAAPGLIYTQLALGTALIAFLAFGAIRIYRARPPVPDGSWVAHWCVYCLVLFGVWAVARLLVDAS